MTEPLECTDDICLPRPRDEEPEGEPTEKEEANHSDDALPKKKPTTKKKSAAGSSNPNIHKIHTQQELDSFLSSNDAVIVEFMTTWCGACKKIEPLWEELATEFVDSVACAQVVCDKNKETKKLATTFGIKSYPVFEVFENASSCQKWNGADTGKLEKAFEKFGGGGGKGKKGGKGGKKKGRK